MLEASNRYGQGCHRGSPSSTLASVAIAGSSLAAVASSTPRRLLLPRLHRFVAVRRARPLWAGIASHAQTVHEDIEQPHHAVLPAGLVVQVAHANQRPQQVFGADVRADFAGCDGTVQQGADGFGQTIERKSGQLRRALHRKRKRRRHALLGCDELDIGSQPAPQGINCIGLALQRFRQFAELLHLAPVDGLEQRLTCRKVAIKRPDADPGPSRHSLEARLGAAGAEHGFRSLQHTLAITDRVGARFSNHCCGGSYHLTPSRSHSHYLRPPHHPISLFEHYLFEKSAPFLRSYGGLESGGYLRICRSASSLARPPIPPSAAAP